MMVTEDQFMPTGPLAITNHFTCKFCEAVVFDGGKECSNLRCQVLFCEGCAGNGNSIRCPRCGQNGVPKSINKKVESLMQILKFICPGCKEGFQHNQIVKHMAQCEDAIALAAKGRNFDEMATGDDKIA